MTKGECEEDATGSRVLREGSAVEEDTNWCWLWGQYPQKKPTNTNTTPPRISTTGGGRGIRGGSYRARSAGVIEDKKKNYRDSYLKRGTLVEPRRSELAYDRRHGASELMGNRFRVLLSSHEKDRGTYKTISS